MSRRADLSAPATADSEQPWALRRRARSVTARGAFATGRACGAPAGLRVLGVDPRCSISVGASSCHRHRRADRHRPEGIARSAALVGQGISKIRRMASEFQGQFQEAMREAEMAELKKSIDEVTALAQCFAYFDPIEVRRVGTTQQQIENPIVDQPAAPASDSACVPAPAAAGSAAADALPIGGGTTEHAAALRTRQPASTPKPERGAEPHDARKTSRRPRRR